MATPQNSEKLYSICEYCSEPAGQAAPEAAGLPSAPMQILSLNCHHSGWKACWIRAIYEVLIPGLGEFENAPRTLSVGSTICWARGIRASSFLPTWWKLRPLADISVPLRIGPSACEQSAELTMPITAGPSLPSTASATSRWVALSRAPNGLAPLQTFCARPSQKLRKLNTASTTLGVLRPVVRRGLMTLPAVSGSGYENTPSATIVFLFTQAVLTPPGPGGVCSGPGPPFGGRGLPPGPPPSPSPPRVKPGPSPLPLLSPPTISATPPSTGLGLPAAEGTFTEPKVELITPCEPDTSFTSELTLKRTLTLETLRNAKSPS